MSKRVLDQVKRLMHELTQAELRDARAFASLRLGSDMAPTTGRDQNDADMALEMICDVMRGKGLDMTNPPSLKRSHQWSAFKAKMGELGPFLKLAAHSRVTRQAFLRLSIELLVKNMDEMNVAVSSRTIMNHIHRLPAVLNQAFPGYAQSGLLKLVIRGENDAWDERSRESLPRRRGKAARE